MSKAVVVMLGNRKTCSYCRSLAALAGNGRLAALLPGAEVIDADASDAPVDYKYWKTRAKMSGNLPQIAVFDQQELKGKFVARSTMVKPWSVGGIAAKIKALCPECCVEGECEDDAADTGCGGACPKCGAKVAHCQACGASLF